MSKATAIQIKNIAAELNWTLEVRGSILTIKKVISGESEFCNADMEYYSILGLLPSTSAGSIWGTDGGGILLPGDVRARTGQCARGGLDLSGGVTSGHGVSTGEVCAAGPQQRLARF